MKRFVLITGDKGGVGKSFISRISSDWYIQEGKEIKLYDADKRNSTLFRFYQQEMSVTQLDYENPGELDHLLNELAESGSDQITFLDCAGSSLDCFRKWMKDVDLFNLQTEFQFRITLVFVLGPSKDCISTLWDTAEYFKDSVDYILVKNLGAGSIFDLYDASNTRKLLLNEYHATEIEVPALLEKTERLIDKWNLSFGKAVTAAELQIADRSRIHVFRQVMHEKISKERSKWM